MKNIMVKDDFKDDYITREAGERLRLMILAAIRNREKLILDFEGLIVASTSFFDEGIAKLAHENLNQEDFKQYIVLKNLNKNDLKVLEKVTEYRGFILS